MGFIARTIFWLGLVYSAMPLDFGSLVPDPVAALTGDNPLTPCVRGGAEDCRRRVGELRKALDAMVALGLADPLVQATEAEATKDLATATRVPDLAAKGWTAPPRRPPQ